jgi:3-isopropylmalate/(R)-2-methylmalate dehydratase small subunit
MEPFVRLDAVAVPLPRPNIDTDQIIPARFLNRLRDEDFSQWLYRDLRFAPDGAEVPDFPLNRPEWRAARIVLGGPNYACGSSREHAVWAHVDYGIRAAIAPSFGDIFRNNGLKNGLLPVVLPADVVQGMIAQVEAAPGARIAIDLPAQTVTGPDGEVHSFDIDPFAKHCLLEGLDELGFTLGLEDEIAAFERRYGRENA